MLIALTHRVIIIISIAIYDQFHHMSVLIQELYDFLDV